MAKKIDYASLFTLRSDGRYQGYWKDEGGGRHTVCDKDPEQLFYKIKAKEAPEDTTFRRFAEEWEAKYRETANERTWKNYKPHYEHIVARVGDKDITEVTGEDVTKDMNMAKGRGLSKTVVNTYRVIYSLIFQYAAEKGKIVYNPALAVKLPANLPKSKRRAPTDEEIDTIIRHREEGFGFVPFALLCTGLRRNELIRRAKAEIDLAAWEIHVPTSKTEAGVRVVPIIEPLRELMAKQAESHPGSPWLFPSEPHAGHGGDHAVLSDTSYDRLWLDYCKKVGWIDKEGKPTLTAHNLRHGTATLLYEAGVDVYTAKSILGHAHIETTMAIYTELRNKHKATGIAKFSESIANLIAN